MPVDPHRSARVFDMHGFLTEIMQSLLILATVAIPVEYFATSDRWLLYGVILFAIIATSWIRSICRHIYQFILLSLVVIALPMVMPILPAFTIDIWPRLIALPTLIFLCGRAFYLRLKQHEERTISDPVQQAMIIFYLLVINLVALRLDLTTLSQIYFYISIIYLMLALYRWHRLALASQLQRFLDMPTQPAEQIMYFNRILLVGYAVVTLVILVISPWLRLHDLLPLIGTGLLAFLRWLFSLSRSEVPPDPEPVPEPTTPPGMQEPVLPFEPSETARWLQILQDIFYYLMIGVVILIVLALFIYTLYSLYKRFYASAQPASDKLESLLPSLTEQTKERARRIRERINLPFSQTPAEKIRRSFYRLVTAQMKRGLKLQTSMTPRQIMQSFDLDKFPELTRMVSLYEAARYGPDISMPAEAEQVMAWCRKMRRNDLLRRDAGEKNS